MKKEKKIPTIVGLLILVISIFFGIFLTVGGRRIFNPKASGDCRPINPQIANITSNSFDVSFITSGSCLSSIIVDNRTIPNFRNSPSKIHYFQVGNLKEYTLYPFSFLNDGSSFSENNYKAQTAKNPQSALPSSNLAWGKILNPDSTPANDAIIYLNIPGASPLSSFVTSNGNWNIPLASSFNESKDDWFIPKGNVQEEIVVLSPEKTTQVTNNTSNNNPVPDITIGVNSTSNNPSQNNNGNINASFESANANKSLAIDNPKEGELVSSLRPDFFGTAAINSSVNLKIDFSDDISGQTTTDSSGVWHWSPPKELSVNNHTLTVDGFDSNLNQQKIIDRKFTITDNSFLSFSATPSAITVTPTSTPVPTFTPTPTPLPTVIVTKPSTNSGIPVTGNSLPTVFFMTIASFFIVFSFIILNKKSN